LCCRKAAAVEEAIGIYEVCSTVGAKDMAAFY